MTYNINLKQQYILQITINLKRLIFYELEVSNTFFKNEY